MGLAPHIEVREEVKEEAGVEKEDASRMQEAHYRGEQRTVEECGDKPHRKGTAGSRTWTRAIGQTAGLCYVVN